MAVAGAILVWLALAAATAFAHRQSGVLTTIEWSDGAGALQVTHRLHVHDAILILEALGVRRPELDRVEDRARVALHVEAHFALAVPGQPERQALLLGAELDGDELFVYQELPCSGEPAAVDIVNTLLGGVVSPAWNTVNVATPAGVRTVTFGAGRDPGAVRVDLAATG
jgi:hypothetical protein